MMRNILVVVSLYAFFLSCDSANSGSENQMDNDSVKTQEKPATTDTKPVAKEDTIIKTQVNKDLANNILGTWALSGMENATFEIEKKKINYPETFTSYKYSLLKDSIKIMYNDYTGSYKISMNGPDTLILVGDEQQTYYRFKN